MLEQITIPTKKKKVLQLFFQIRTQRSVNIFWTIEDFNKQFSEIKSTIQVQVSNQVTIY